MLALLLSLLLLGACSSSPATSDGGNDTGSGPSDTLADGAGPADATDPNARVFVRIEPGMFTMGSTSEWATEFEEPEREVTLTRPFEIQTTEVTQAQYQEVMDDNTALFGGCPLCPVERIKWHEAVAYTNALSAKEGFEPCYTISGEDQDEVVFLGLDCTGYRLPTEAEWEYAARAGSTSEWFCGAEPDCLEGYGWLKSNSASKTHEVATVMPNAWGLYDMVGNVYEWTNDWHAPDYYAEGQNTDPIGPEEGFHRAYRGGSWSSEPPQARSSDRSINLPNEVEGNPCGGQFCWPDNDDGTKWYYHSPDLGFRIVRTLPD